MAAVRMLIGGKLVGSSDEQWRDAVNPATEEVVGRFPGGTRADAARAVEAAVRAAGPWAETSMAQRAALVRRLAAAVRGRAEELARLEVADSGNGVAKVRNDVESACAALEYFAGLGLELKGSTVPASPNALHASVRVPYGPVVRIAPFNHPFLFSSRIGAPLMAGNAVIVKPPEQSSLSAGLFAEICADIVDPGLVNVVMGDGSVVGDELVRSPQVKRIAFTGSVATGMAVQHAAAEVAVKHVSLELGGKNPLIVFPGTDPGAVAEAAVRGMNLAWQGQSCGSTSRLFLHESLYEAVLEKLLDRVASVRVGDPFDERSSMGPLNSLAHYERTLRYIASGISDGARLLAGGRRPEGKQYERGYWLLPTVFADVRPQMRIFREEIFGPVLSVLKWSDENEMFAAVNGVSYGLTAAIWSPSLNTALRAAHRVEAGYVWVNDVSSHYMGCGFGGVKNSGVGREESIDELFSFTETKTIHLTF